MEKDVDLSIRLAGLTFKSPIVVASSECAANLSQVQNLVDKNIGAIVTKTYTSPPLKAVNLTWCLGGAKPLEKQFPLPLNKGKGIKGMGFRTDSQGVEVNKQPLDNNLDDTLI